MLAFGPSYRWLRTFPFVWDTIGSEQPLDTRLAKLTVVSTTTTTARRHQRQRAQDRALLQVAKANARLTAHHGSAGMSWRNSKGKGKQTMGQWVWQEDPNPKHHQGKGAGGGKGKGDDSKKMAQLQAQITAMDKKLTQAQNSKKDTKDRTDQILLNGTKVLAKNSEGPVCIVCPTCQTEHNNPKKYKCRNPSCRAILRPDSVPPSALVASKAPRNPLLTGYFQALLQDAGAKECLEGNLKAPDPATVATPIEAEDLDDEMEIEGPEEDARSKAEEILHKLMEWKADQSLIKEQKAILEKLPKPKMAKKTQPILDVSKLLSALSQATEYHSLIHDQNAKAVQACEDAIQQAQANLEKMKAIQVESQAKADRQLRELRELIQKKQLETPEVLAATVKPAGPPQDNPDQTLMVQEVQNWLIQQQCPDHIKVFFSKMQFPEEASRPVPEATRTTNEEGIGNQGGPGGANGGQAETGKGAGA